MPALHHLVATLLVERQAGEAGADHHPLVSGRGDDRLGAAEQGAAHAEARPVGIDVEAAQLLALHRAEADRPGQAGYRHLETLAVAAHGLDIALRAVAVHPALDLAVVVDLAAQPPPGTPLPPLQPPGPRTRKHA